MDAIELRPATPEDADAVEAYHARCFDKTYASQLLAGAIEPPDRDGMRRQFRDWFRPDSDVDTQLVMVDRVPTVESMLVDAGHAVLELHTRVDNVAAIAFYEKAGWTVTDHLIRTTEHGISYDEHVLVKHRPSTTGSSQPRNPAPLTSHVSERCADRVGADRCRRPTHPGAEVVGWAAHLTPRTPQWRAHSEVARSMHVLIDRTSVDVPI